MEEDEMRLDLSENYIEVPVNNESKKSNKRQTKQVAKDPDELVSCLRNERVIVRFINKRSPLIINNNDEKHVAHGGLIDNGKRRFSLVRLTNGSLKNCLTDAEKDYLEYVLGLEPNALSVYKKDDNYWTSGSGNAEISLTKDDTYLDLSNPHDYIIYKMLLANSDTICPSLSELETNHKETYQYVLINENDEANIADQEMSITSKCYLEIGKYIDNKYVLKVIIETLEKKDLDDNTKIEFLRLQINNQIKNNPKLFLGIVTDPYLEMKVLIKRACRDGILSKRGSFYYVTEGNQALCNSGDEPTLDNAAKFLSGAKRQDLLLKIQAKLNQKD